MAIAVALLAPWLAPPGASAAISTPYFGALSATMTDARAGAVAAPLPDGDVLIAGGTDNGSDTLSSAEVFDPSNDSFSALSAPMTTPREDAVAAPLPDGDVLIAGGTNGTDALSSAELFDPSTDTFSLLPNSMNTPREGAVAAPLADGDVLIAGGTNGTDVLSSAELFDPSTGTFSLLPNSMNTPREGAVAAPLPDGRVLIAGGSNTSGDLSSAEVFDPSTGTFSALSAQMTTPRTAAVAATLPDGAVLIAGGVDGGGYLSSAEVFMSAAEAAMAGADFGDQTVGQPSVAQQLVVTNVGAQTLSISGASLTGADAGDFQITADDCTGAQLAFQQSCTISASFTPSAAGLRQATLTLADNEATPASAALSGTGVGASSGSSGPPSTTSSQGTTTTTVGAGGAQGTTTPVTTVVQLGQLLLATCKTSTERVSVDGNKRKVKIQKCTLRLISGTATFTAISAKATLERGHVVYATGTARLDQLVLRPRRRIRAGSYTLVISHRKGKRWVSKSQQITIT